jgi:hypothetical protein
MISVTFVVWKKIKTLCPVEENSGCTSKVKFAGNATDVFVNETSRIYLVFDAVEEVRVLANLAQLQEFIAQTLDTSWTSDSMYTFSKV